MQEVDKSILKKIYTPRPLDSRKYDFGLILVIGGSQFYSGSPALSAFAAFKSGADMVRIIAPKRAADIIASFSPIMAAYPLEGESLKKEHLATLISMTESAETVSRGKTAVVIGGGVGRSEETQEVIREYLKNVTVPVVIDADAIHALGAEPGLVAGRNFVLTPQTYEFFVLTKKEIYQLPDGEKVKMVEEEAKRLQTTLLLKGRVDIISNGTDTALNNTGCAFMTAGGMGDTLAGIVGALLGRGVSTFDAACAGAFINGFAGEAAGKAMGESTTAVDLIEAITKVLPK